MFTHLHVHSEYSLLDGASRVEDIVKRAKELGQTSIALTDHGVMFGAVNFYNACKKEGIKPIIGCEVYVASKSRFDRDVTRDEHDRAHLVLLVRNEEGYKNLIKMVSLAFTEGFYYKPRVDMELLKKHGKGLIALSACLAGEIPQRLLAGDIDGAKEKVFEFKEIFDEFYLELQDHKIPAQKKVNTLLLKLSEETNTPLVATNDTHYTYREDSFVQDALLCIQTGKTLDEESRMRFETDEFYIKSEEEMRERFKFCETAIDNTQKIADMCNFDFDFNGRHLPKYELPSGEEDSFLYLEKLCNEGLKKRYGKNLCEAKKRLDYELGVIKNMGFTDYFLVVWDFVNFAKKNNISVGPGRGSAAGSIVSYSLFITDIDPLKYNLLFERFLNPERVSMPDIDIDFCYERRGEVIDYVTKKYGEDHVTQIVTFNTMKARGAIRDTGRVLGIPLPQVDTVAKAVPRDIGITLKEALNTPVLKELYDSDETAKKLVDTAIKVEGLPRNAGTHAAGVVICKDPVNEHIPLQKNGDTVTTQFTMETVEKLGLLKMDFLGLRNLTVIRDCIRNIEAVGKHLDIETISYDCPEVYEMISRGETDGVFQLESAGMRAFMKGLLPSNLEDIIAGIALYRPGPMDFIPQYIENKENPDKITYKHPLLKDILDVTYGCIVYQEQVMQIVRSLAGFSLGKADEVRRAMSKKKADVMVKVRQEFIEGSVKRGIDKKVAESIFDDMDAFARYAFNKAHATSYAVVAYRTAYLKCFYPAEYMAALMTNVMGEAEKLAIYTEKCKKMGIEVLTPDINKSFCGFSVENGKIRFGLGSVKNVGVDFINSCVEEREKNGRFTSISDFCTRMTGVVNKRALEGLVMCGAFDLLKGNRAQKMAYFETALENASRTSKQNLDGQLSLFGDSEITEDEFPNIKEYTSSELLSMEKQATGIYLSGHPLDSYRHILENSKNTDCATLLMTDENGNTAIKDKSTVSVSGIITSVKTKITRNNTLMAYLVLEDLTGSVEVLAFPKVWQRIGSMLNEDAIVTLTGRADVDDERGVKILLEDASPLSEPSEKVLQLLIEDNKLNLLDTVREIVLKYPGNVPIKVNDTDVVSSLNCDGSKILLSEIEEILGKDSIVFK